MKNLLEVDNVNASYEGLQVLWDISLEVKEAECVSLIGANGAGKTTLINTISGFLHPDKGSIIFEGRNIDRLETPKISELGLIQVPEGRGVFPELTVEENLLMGCYLKEKRKKESQLMENTCELFPWLEERKDQTAGNLSGGEQQMLAIAKGLMSDPKLLMLDEVSLSLAPVARGTVYKKIEEINNRGITTLLVDENVRRALDLSDRAYVMESGRITLSGDPEDLKENEEFVSCYFGID